jgi:hypothetical protein
VYPDTSKKYVLFFLKWRSNIKLMTTERIAEQEYVVRDLTQISECNATVVGTGPLYYDHKEQKELCWHFSEECDPRRGCAVERLLRDQGVEDPAISQSCARGHSNQTVPE